MNNFKLTGIYPVCRNFYLREYFIAASLHHVQVENATLTENSIPNEEKAETEHNEKQRTADIPTPAGPIPCSSSTLMDHDASYDWQNQSESIISEKNNSWFKMLTKNLSVPLEAVATY